MYLETRVIPKWPKLSWVATISDGSDRVDVLHGPMVEKSEEWVAEAVWVGDFESGDFDQTDLVFGTGVRCRDRRLIFVTAATAMDRLWYCRKEGQVFVSNSLGALSACADISLIENHEYVNDRHSDFRTTWGLDSCTREMPAEPVNVQLIWFNNLLYDGQRLYEEKKPDTAPTFRSFNDYRDYLFRTAQVLKRNLGSAHRSHRITPVATVSSGYDSPAAAVIARQAGCRKAISIRQSSSLWRGADSGEQIARQLGMSCQLCNRTAKSYPHESSFWAASGWANLLNWTLFPYPDALSILFQGNYGDAIWDRRPLPQPFTIDIWDDLALGEFRLIVGVEQCPVPFWGMRHAAEIKQITFADEMRPWTLNRSYDRPIPRRIVEETGVPRDAFAVRKKDTSHEVGFRWPYSAGSRSDFNNYLRARGNFAPSPLAVKLIRGYSVIESLFFQNIFRKLGVRKRFRPWHRIAGTRLLYQWANHRLKETYQTALKDIGICLKK